jgi:hypothetical protein
MSNSLDFKIRELLRTSGVPVFLKKITSSSLDDMSEEKKARIFGILTSEAKTSKGLVHKEERITQKYKIITERIASNKKRE